MVFMTGKMLAPAEVELADTPDHVLWECVRNGQEAITGHQQTIGRFQFTIDKLMAELEKRAKARAG